MANNNENKELLNEQELQDISGGLTMPNTFAMCKKRAGFHQWTTDEMGNTYCIYCNEPFSLGSAGG